MDPSYRWTYLKIWALISLALVLLFPDVVFDTTMSILSFVFHHLLELAHILFESMESILDHLIEGLFETDLHSTQTIVFYILFAIGSFFIYRAGRSLLRLFRRLHESWGAFSADHQLNLFEHWRGMTAFEKVRLVVITGAAIYIYVSFFI